MCFDGTEEMNKGQWKGEDVVVVVVVDVVDHDERYLVFMKTSTKKFVSFLCDRS